ncbi:TniB family NTP-binding protein [Tropicimonas sp. TH_r6]|uniref:TniB family NTP-binding protein n=1 Tax=Tropicimonas sp. TH_r6 TaxID=3082085 RepID=UPI002952C144|nr:TniB family NTP-binding protein [Tropicimonas sp. TH_r6]MDV7144759.1 TniB family NTP-binding protein [Tropicimonas sp. TH_r6]
MNRDLIVALDKTIRHDRYERALAQMIEAIELADQMGGAVIPFLGGTRCGKSRLLEDLQSQVGRIVKTPGGLFEVSDFALGTIATKPNDRTLLLSMMGALGMGGKRGQTASELQSQVDMALRDNGTRVLALDECSHCAERGAHLSKRGATDHFKWLVDRTGLTLILCGLPKFQGLVDDNEQLRDRSLATVYLNPYAWERDEDRTAFAAAVSQALRHLNEAGALLDFDFEDVVYRLYGLSGGRVGAMMKVLRGSVHFMRDGVMTSQCIAKSAKATSQKELNSARFFGENRPTHNDLVRSYVRVMQEAGLEIEVSSITELSFVAAE